MGPAPTAVMAPSRARSADDEPQESITSGWSTVKTPQSQNRCGSRLSNVHSNLIHTPGRLGSMVTNLVSRLDKDEVIHRDDMDYLLNLFKDDFERDGTGLLPAVFFDMPVSNSGCHGTEAPNGFIAPIYHEPGHWSIVYVSRLISPKVICVRHYDPISHEGRHAAVKKKVKAWAEKSAPHLGFHCRSEDGPKINTKSGNSAVHVVMAAREFSHSNKIPVGTTKNWDKPDPKLFLKQTLRDEYHEKRGSPNNPWPVSSDNDSSDDNGGRTSTQTTPAATPTPTRPVKKPATLPKAVHQKSVSAKKQKDGKLYRPKELFSSTPRDNQRQTPPASTSTGSLGTPSVATPSGKRATTGSVPDERSEPNSKRRRTCMDQPLSFSIEETMEEYKSFSENLALPSIDDLYQEREKRKHTFDEQDRGLQNKRKELERCDNEYAKRIKTFNDHEQEYNDLKDKVAADELEINNYIARLPLPQFNTLSGDALQPVFQSFKATFDNHLTPIKASLNDKLGKKREAEKFLKSAADVCSDLKKRVDAAEASKNEAESALKDSCQREEMAAVVSEFSRKMQAIQTGLEREDWYETFCERRNAP